jgi:3-(3-hydroxy-phenyl)propionate hydroxylase
MSELLAMEAPRKRLAGVMSGLDVRYDLGDGHPLVGRRMPDLELTTENGTVRVFTLLHDARPVLIRLGGAGAAHRGPADSGGSEGSEGDDTPRANGVRLIDAGYEGRLELPVIGEVEKPAAVLIRPDGYVAWAGDRDQRGLADALATWSA